MRRSWRLAVVLAALATPAAAVTAARAATPPAPHASPVASARATAPATARAAAPRVHPTAAAAAPTAVPVPLHAPGDASAAGRRLLRAINSVDEGFLLALPGAGPKGPTAYIPPQPTRSGDDTGSLVLAGAAGLLVAVGSGAVVLFWVLRPQPVPANPPARASVALAPAQRSRAPRRPAARLSQDAFDRLPPLLQLAVLDRARPPAETDEAALPVTPAS